MNQKVNAKTPKAAPKGARWVDPLLRPVVAATIPGSGVDVAVEPTAQELAALTRALGLNEIKGLHAQYRLARRSGGIISVDGRLKGRVVPTCVLTLEAFDLAIDEPVALRFIELATNDRRQALEEKDVFLDDDPPDVIENGQIDLGRVTTEFLSLAIPAFPRKPGAELETAREEGKDLPFAGLARLKP